MKTVLIIEDDRAVAATYRHKFKEAGYRVEIAPDGVEGVKLVSTLRPDAVVLDLLMPRMDGIEVLKFIRGHAELNGTPVVVFSNSYMTSLVESAWRAGADECLMKSSTMPGQLLDAVKKVMARTGHRRTLQASAPVSPVQLAPPAVVPLGFAVPPTVVTRPPGSKPAILPGAPAVPPSLPATIPPAPVSPVPRTPPVSASAADRLTINYEQVAQPSSTAKPPSGTTYFVVRSQLVAEPDTEFQAQIRELFLAGSGVRLENIRNLAAAFVQDDNEADRATHLEGLFRLVHALAGNAGLAGCALIAQFASTFEVLLKELRDEPEYLSGSTLNTVARSVETLEGMFVSPEEIDSFVKQSLSALVIESDTESAHAAAAALEAARVRTTATADPVFGMGQLASTSYDLVVAGINLSGMTGFELLAHMEVLPNHANTPIVFVTTHDNFASYMLDGLVARHDLIAKPYLSIELTLKALAWLHRKRLQP
jgi:CheY-like chemotaxis protein